MRLCRKKNIVKEISLELMTYCYEGTTIDLLDKLFERAEKEN